MNPLSIPSMLGGGMFSPWLLIAAGVVLAGTNAYTGYKFYNIGQDTVMADWNQEKADRAKAALEATNKFNEEKGRVEQAAREKVSDLDRQHQLQVEEKEKENAALRRRVSSGAVRLSVPAVCPGPVAVGVGVGGSSVARSPGVSDGPTRVELPAATSLDILAVGEDADRVTDQLRTAQALIRQYVEQCGSPRKLEKAPSK